jgi:hypothetical protein
MPACRHALSGRAASPLCAEGRVAEMDVLVVCDAGVERHDVTELPRLLERQDAVIWIDIPMCDKVAAEALSGVFGFHRIAVHDCVERNHVSKVHIWSTSTPTTYSPCCTHRSSASAVTSTTSSWTSSSAATTWSPCTGR